MGAVFVALADNWFLNLAHVIEVSFQDDGEAEITSWAEGDTGDVRIVRWYVDREAAIRLRTALIAQTGR